MIGFDRQVYGKSYATSDVTHEKSPKGSSGTLWQRFMAWMQEVLSWVTDLFWKKVPIPAQENPVVPLKSKDIKDVTKEKVLIFKKEAPEYFNNSSNLFNTEKYLVILGNIFPEKSAREIVQLARDTKARGSNGKTLKPEDISNTKALIGLFEGDWNEQAIAEAKLRSDSTCFPFWKNLHRASKHGIFDLSNESHRAQGAIELRKLIHFYTTVEQVRDLSINNVGMSILPQELEEALLLGDREDIQRFIQSEESVMDLIQVRAELLQRQQPASATQIIDATINSNTVNYVNTLEVMFPEKSREECWQLAIETPGRKGHDLQSVDLQNLRNMIKCLEGEWTPSVEKEIFVRRESLLGKVSDEILEEVTSEDSFIRRNCAMALRGYTEKRYPSVEALYQIHIGPNKPELDPRLEEAISIGDRAAMAQFVNDQQAVNELLATQKELTKRRTTHGVLAVEVIIEANRKSSTFSQLIE